MSITFLNSDIDFPALDTKKITAWVRAVAASQGKRAGNINYIFCSDEKILEVNRQFLAHDYFTDIITFDYSEGDTISGDIFISLETVKSNTKMLQTPYSEELDRVIIHGILHLCGQGDKTENEAKIMREMENKALQLIEN